MTTQMTWGTTPLVFEWCDGAPVRLVAARGAAVHPTPVVEILTVGDGRTSASSRLTHTALGASLRYASHIDESDGEVARLRIRQRTDAINADLVLEQHPGVDAVRAVVELIHRGGDPVVLRAVASWSAGFTSGDSDPLDGWTLVHGRSDWLGEGRWGRMPLRGTAFPDLAEELTGHNPRGSYAQVSTGTWSTGRVLPTGALVEDEGRRALAWQIEHNGAWRWEIGEDTVGGHLALSGPTDDDAAWTRVLRAGEMFSSVPVSVAFGDDLTGAMSALTAHRRASRRPHADNFAMPVVFNDYMNTLNGDPTTARLLPLVRAAADVGAEVFCIDAGWYDDTGYWWDGVGAWSPSTTRFPAGLGEVIDAIRDAGMIPGLWLEPEVVGVRSPVADELPAAAFLQRHGCRVVEHGRYHLDLRHPAAVAHLDDVVDRLVRDFGIGFFKLDYNIDPGPGSDRDADSVGDALLNHNRAHLAWIDGVLDRHPDLILENCGSGAMRMDQAMLSRLQMQSTSDQQDFAKYPPIAASAPMSMIPEQAASWAYPQPEMSDEEAAFCLVTGLLGRFYVSGHLNEMTAEQRDRVARAIDVAKELRGRIAGADPHWPCGLPGWSDEAVALGLRDDEGDLVALWRRGDPGDIDLDLRHLRGHDVRVETVFPAGLPVWSTSWDAAAGRLRVHPGDAPVAARLLRIAPAGGSITSPS